MYRKRFLSLIATACSLSGAIAFAQQAPRNPDPPNRAANADDAAAGRMRIHPDGAAQQPINQGPANTIIEKPGDSMLELGNEGVPTDPQQAKNDEGGFFAVPAPTPKTLKKHDLVTIVIREQSDYTATGDNNFDKKAELQAKLDQFVQLDLKKFAIRGFPQSQNPADIDVSGERTFNGTGQVDRTDSMNARIEAEIVDVKPNGTLVLQARKKIKQDSEEQEFILSGICRVEDVTADNTVLSSQLFDLDLQKNQKGDIRQATKRGLIPKILDFLDLW
ncbi:MAG TPA: flagellar basal body L-ring protein FlgH [Tepidisphaeraceae bacterium]|jgi:flagellar L-ring protein precursor FlgH|nr:flagellar basal body L-ring protein FlgH [Tepidisphaeraceae bacterium]